MISAIKETEYQLLYDNQNNPAKPCALSIVTPNYNRGPLFTNLLISLINQNINPELFELVVVDDGGEAQEIATLKKTVIPFRVRYFWQAHQGRRAGRVRNIGIKNAQGEIVVFLDSDAVASPNLVSEHLRQHKKHRQLVIIGDLLSLYPEEKPVFKPWLGWIRSKRSLVKFILHHLKLKFITPLVYRLFGCPHGLCLCSLHASAKREHLLAIDGFDETFDGRWGDEDHDLGYRLEKLGLQVLWLGRAFVYHQWHPIHFNLEMTDNRLRLFLKHPEILPAFKIGGLLNPFHTWSIEEIRQLYNLEEHELPAPQPPTPGAARITCDQQISQQSNSRNQQQTIQAAENQLALILQDQHLLECPLINGQTNPYFGQSIAFIRTLFVWARRHRIMHKTGFELMQLSAVKKAYFFIRHYLFPRRFDLIKSAPAGINAAVMLQPTGQPRAFKLLFDNQVKAPLTPELSLIITTYNKRKYLNDLFYCLAQQTLAAEKFEVIVADDGGKDDSWDYLRQQKFNFRLRYIWQEDCGFRGASNKNNGVAAARGEIIVLVDADGLFPADFLEAHYNQHLAQKQLCLAGLSYYTAKPEKISLAEILTQPPRAIKLKRLQRKLWVESIRQPYLEYLAKKNQCALGTCVSSIHCSFKKSDHAAIGGFDEAFNGTWGDEDIEFGYRLEQHGLPIEFMNHTLVYHRWHPYTSSRGLSDANRLYFLLKHPELLNKKIINLRQNKYFHRQPAALKQRYVREKQLQITGGKKAYNIKWRELTEQIIAVALVLLPAYLYCIHPARGTRRRKVIC